MPKFIFSLLILCSSCRCLAQEIKLTPEEKASLDSMFRNDEFFKMLNERADTSYFEISVGVSNGIFSLKNNSLNANQAETRKIYFTPSAGYFNKRGFGISVTPYLASDSGRLKIFQYAISPSYSYYGKKINAGVTYTRLIKGAITGFEVNPYKNDLYGSMVFKKIWLRPSLAAGFSSGRTIEKFDTTFLLTLPQMPAREYTIHDTITSRLSSFSLTFSLSHEWEFDNVFLHNDELDLQPSFLINGSNQKLKINQSNSLNARRPVVQKLLKAAYGSGSNSVPFSLQSVAFLGSITYGRKRILFQPQLYLDYYISETESKRLTALYSFVISYAF